MIAIRQEVNSFDIVVHALEFEKASYNLLVFSCFIFEPAHDKTRTMNCAPSEHSNQPGHPPRLIGVLRFALNGQLKIIIIWNVQNFFCYTALTISGGSFLSAVKCVLSQNWFQKYTRYPPTPPPHHTHTATSNFVGYCLLGRSARILISVVRYLDSIIPLCLL